MIPFNNFTHRITPLNQLGHFIPIVIKLQRYHQVFLSPPSWFWGHPLQFLWKWTLLACARSPEGRSSIWIHCRFLVFSRRWWWPRGSQPQWQQQSNKLLLKLHYPRCWTSRIGFVRTQWCPSESVSMWKYVEDDTEKGEAFAALKTHSWITKPLPIAFAFLLYYKTISTPSLPILKYKAGFQSFRCKMFSRNGERLYFVFWLCISWINFSQNIKIILLFPNGTCCIRHCAASVWKIIFSSCLQWVCCEVLWKWL